MAAMAEEEMPGHFDFNRPLPGPGFGAGEMTPAATKAEQLFNNRVQGKAFEDATFGERFDGPRYQYGREVTIDTEGGRIRVDGIVKDLETGEVFCVECKSSATAPLTPNQQTGIPALELGGGTIAGAGK